MNVGDSLSQSRSSIHVDRLARPGRSQSLSLYAFVRSFVFFSSNFSSSSSSSPPSMQRHIEDKSERRYTGKQHTHTNRCWWLRMASNENVLCRRATSLNVYIHTVALSPSSLHFLPRLCGFTSYAYLIVQTRSFNAL